ncbi:hypothetical protein Hanom_Chr09g00821961 [Helianthus anomalus]
MKITKKIGYLQNTKMKIYKNTNILMDLEDLLDLEHHVQHQTSFGSSSISNRHLKHHLQHRIC